MDHVKLTGDKLDIQTVTELVTSPKCGAVSIFVGTTRDSFEDKTVVTLEYEAYEAMACKCMKQICVDVREKWPQVENIAIYHRLGTVPVCEASVIIAVSSPHRNEAMQATQWCIDTLKTTVPVWKKEVYLNEAPEWKENKECSWSKSANSPNKFEVEVPFIYSHLIASNANLKDVFEKVDKFIKKKQNETNLHNVRDFCADDATNVGFEDVETCARSSAKLCKRKDSKGHLQVNRVMNYWNRDQGDNEYLKRHIPVNGIEERLKNLERQLNIRNFGNRSVTERLRQIETRLLHLECVSAEYAQSFPFEVERLKQKSPVKMKSYSLYDVEKTIDLIERKKARIVTLETCDDVIL